jgi:hypothetical protein
MIRRDSTSSESQWIRLLFCLFVSNAVVNLARCVSTLFSIKYSFVVRQAQYGYHRIQSSEHIVSVRDDQESINQNPHKVQFSSINVFVGLAAFSTGPIHGLGQRVNVVLISDPQRQEEIIKTIV